MPISIRGKDGKGIMLTPKPWTPSMDIRGQIGLPKIASAGSSRDQYIGRLAMVPATGGTMGSPAKA